MMRPGLYKVETIDKRTALLTSLESQSEQFTFPVSGFSHDVSQGDVIEIWREGTNWRTKYREKETKSISSHTKDFLKRIMDQE